LLLAKALAICANIHTSRREVLARRRRNGLVAPECGPSFELHAQRFAE
jgi:hypothetical protein